MERNGYSSIATVFEFVFFNIDYLISNSQKREYVSSIPDLTVSISHSPKYYTAKTEARVKQDVGGQS